MGQKPRVRSGLSSGDPSQDVEYTIDQQIDEGQHERDEKENGGPLGPAKSDEALRQQPTLHQEHPPAGKKKPTDSARP